MRAARRLGVGSTPPGRWMLVDSRALTYRLADPFASAAPDGADLWTTHPATIRTKSPRTAVWHAGRQLRWAGEERWSDYDGDDVYGDFEIDGGNAVTVRSFEPGIARVTAGVSDGGAWTDYYHGDHLGTTRRLTDTDGESIAPAVYTAFGFAVTVAPSGPTRRNLRVFEDRFLTGAARK